MHIEKIKYTAQYEAGRKIAEWIGLEASPGFEETADQVFKSAQEQVAKWHEQSNPFINPGFPGQEAPPVINVRDQLIPDAENDTKFKQLKETLEIIKYREEAQVYLDGTEFKHTIEAKKIVNSKPKRNV